MTWVPTRRTCLTALAAGLPLGHLAAQPAYPARPVRIVVPFGPGGVADITVRLVAERLGERLGGRFVIENMPSAGGVLAGRTAAASDPDGHTLALFTNGTAVSVGLFNKLPFDPLGGFAPISTLGTFDFLFAVNKAAGIDGIPALLRRAKETPGSINVATVAVGSTQHLASVLFNGLSGAGLVHVPFRNTPEAVTALIRQDVHVVIDSQAAMKAGLEGGEIRAIAGSGARRSAFLPDLPTVQEGGVAGYDVTSWNALFAPKGTPPQVVARLADATREVLALPEVKARLAELGIEAAPETPDALAARLRADVGRWRGVIDGAGIAKQ